MWQRERARELPTWPERSGKVRVLVEDDDGATGMAAVNILKDEGYDAMTCGGPAELSGGRCPLVDRGRCGLVGGADVVVCSLRLSSSDNAEVLRAVKRLHPTTPIVVEVTEPQATALGHLLDGCEKVAFPFTRKPLLRAVSAAAFRWSPASF
jgi:CheY-like chemotaxis protein